jgi:hypothetical protein
MEKNQDLNESASYETPFQSFLNISPSRQSTDGGMRANGSTGYYVNGGSNKQRSSNSAVGELPVRSSGIVQGTPFNIDQLMDNLNDLSVSSNELTPRQEETFRASKLDKTKEDIMRAKNLVNQ